MASLRYVGASSAQASSGFFGFQQLLGCIQIGKDTTNNFAWSLSGLAILRADGTYVAKDEDGEGLLDVTPLILAGVAPCVFRLPVETVGRGDLIVTSDCPFSVLFVLKVDDYAGRIRCLDPLCGEIVEYSRPASLFFNFFVKVVSLYDLLRVRQDEEEEE
jgi:hypothetical protein